MSGLDILGGIGKGVMIGADQMRRQEAHDANLAMQQEQMAMQRKQQEANDARLAMLQENQGWQRTDRARQEEERQRIDALGKLRTGIESSYGELADFEREEMFFTNGLRAGLFKPEEIQAAKASRDGLYQNFGVEAVDEAIYAGDVTKLQSIAAKKFPGMQIAAAGDTFQITKPDGKTERVSRSGLAQAFGLTKVAEREAARAAAELAANKTRSEITKNEATAGAARAQAGNYAEQTRGRKLENEGLAALEPKARATSGSRSPNAPAEVQTAQWLIDNKVAKDAADAWDLVRTARGRSRDDAIAGIYTKLQADPLNSRKDPKELVRQATQAYDAITGAGAVVPAPGVVNPEDPMSLFSEDDQ